MSPRRVLHVLSGAMGGATMSAMGLMETHRRQGIESCAICDPAGTDQVKARLADLTDGRVHFVPVYWMNVRTRAAPWKRPLLELRQGLRTGWAYGSGLRALRRALAWKPDLVHTCNIMISEGAGVAAALGLPHVWHLRELVGRDEPFRLRREGHRLGRFLGRWASQVVANSHVAASKLSPFLMPDRLSVVVNGIDCGPYTAVSGPSSGPGLTLGLVGSVMSRVKNHGLFLEAAARVSKTTTTPIRFRVYGEMPQGPDSYLSGLAARARSLGLEDCFEFAGFRPNPVDIMKEIDVLVHAASEESFGRVVVEAMAAGRPVVGVRGGGVQEIVQDGETGLLSSPDDPVGMARSMQRLVNSAELRERMGGAGRARACELYSLEACAARMLEVYEKAGRRPLRPWGV